uniref:Uncharacterized protein n=1 Tax=Arundo donax TaxID=35708 RepID=A0A0A8YV91_ARUDO
MPRAFHLRPMSSHSIPFLRATPLLPPMSLFPIALPVIGEGAERGGVWTSTQPCTRCPDLERSAAASGR